MLLLFTSNAQPKYQRDALASLALPGGSVLRMRYFVAHVADDIQRISQGRTSGQLGLPRSDRRALIVYAEGVRSDSDKPGPLDSKHPFAFFPLRFATILRIHRQGSVFYVDVRLDSYPKLRDENGNTSTSLSKFRAVFEERGKRYPLPPPPMEGGEALVWDDGKSNAPSVRSVARGERVRSGNFLDRRASALRGLESADEHLGWESVVDALIESDLKQSPFFRVAGFFRVRQGRLSGFMDKRIVPRPKWPEVEYVFPIATHIVMGLEAYRPSKAGVPKFTIIVDAIGDAFAGCHPKENRFESRYDQRRVVIASKRILDNVMGTITVKCEAIDPTPPGVASPELAFIVRSAPSLWFRIRLIALMVLAAVLLSITGDLFAYIAQWLEDAAGRATATSAFLASAKGDLALVCKGLGAVATIAFGWLAFRRLPVGK